MAEPHEPDARAGGLLDEPLGAAGAHLWRWGRGRVKRIAGGRQLSGNGEKADEPGRYQGQAGCGL